MTDKQIVEEPKKDAKKKIPLWAIALGLSVVAAVATTTVVYVAAQPESPAYFRRFFNFGKRLYNRFWLQQAETYNPLHTAPPKDPFAASDDDDLSSIE